MLSTESFQRSETTAAQTVVHDLYGIRIRTPWPLPYATCRPSDSWDVEFAEADADELAAARSYIAPQQEKSFYQRDILPDGSCYCCWTDVIEFLVSPDRLRIQARSLKYSIAEAFQAYLLVQGLSFSMVRLGREPLHATAVLTAKGVVGFLGDSGYGKSTLGALFVQAGFPLVTDDMLVLSRNESSLLAYPGPPRVKLYRETASRIFDDTYTGVPMNAATEKLIIPLRHEHVVQEPQPLLALYVIGSPTNRCPPRIPLIRRVSGSHALIKVLAGTLNDWDKDNDRLKRQFEFAARLVNQVPVKVLSYRRNQNEMDRVRDTVLADIVRL